MAKSAKGQTPTLAVAATLAFVVGAMISCLCSGDVYYAKATLSLVSGHQGLLPPYLVLCLRLTMASTIWFSLGEVLSSREPLVIKMEVFPDSKLKNKAIHLLGWRRLVTFTVQSWTLMGVYFTLSSMASALNVYGVFELPSYQPVAFLTWVLYQTSFTAAFLVTVVTTFVLFPLDKKRGGDCSVLLKRHPLMFHNLNVIFMAIELVVSGIPFMKAHFPFCGLWPCWYAFFAWCWVYFQGEVMYPFVDPTLPPEKAVPLLLVLFGVFGTFFLFGLFISTTAVMVPLPIRVAAVAIGTGSILKLKY